MYILAEYANLLKKNGDWKTGAKEKLSEDDRKVYESNYKEYRNGASKANERITSKFALFTDALNRKNWLEFRKSITLDEFYKPEEVSRYTFRIEALDRRRPLIRLRL
jgi:hypothetical protein